MQLERCTAQGPHALDEAYQVWVRRGPGVGIDGRAMLALIEQLRAHPDERHAWGLTSHATLCLLSADDAESPWYVTIFAPSYGGYRVEYLLPPSSAPWPRAYVHGEAKAVSDAVAMVLIAMDRSEGWAKPECDSGAMRRR